MSDLNLKNPKFDSKNRSFDGLVLGTQNPGKIREFQDLFQLFDLTVLGLDSFQDLNLDDPEETGVTFFDNALIKAQYYAKALNRPVLADDSGLCIDALDYKPGVYTKRFFADCGGYEQGFVKVATLVEKSHLEGALSHLSNPYAASMHCVLVIAWPDGSHIDFEGICEGQLAFPPRYGVNKSDGFGVDPIFQPVGHQKTFAEDIEYKHRVSHRIKALAKVKDYLEKVSGNVGGQDTSKNEAS